MEFRFLALIALWTLLSGPVFSKPSAPSSVEQPAPMTKKADSRSGSVGLPSARP